MGRIGIPRGLVVLLGVAAAVVAAAGIRSLAWFIGPVFLAMVIVIALAPVLGKLRDHGWPAWAATAALAVAVYAVVLAMALCVVVSAARLASALPEYAVAGRESVGSATSLLERFGVEPAELRRVVESLDLGKVTQAAVAVLSGIAGLASNLIFLLTLLLFLSVETGSTRDRIAIVAADRPSVAGALVGFARNTRQYLVVSTVFGLIVGVLDTIALLFMGVPLAVTWGVLAFVTNYIPNIGFLIGVVPPALLALLVHGPDRMLLVILVYCVLNFVVQSLIQPRFVGDAVGLSMTVTFLSLVFWAWLLGPLGAVLAIPLTLLAKSLLVDIDPRARWAHAFLCESPPAHDAAEPAPDAVAGLGAARDGSTPPHRPWHRRHRQGDEAVPS
ncbi:AI-2E family transporter [Pseudonocardia broussonetiae]|uniref:AI-2E family transporter n=1 Tax=Pseudonocardia broussonetiae TaxID=2736640 RepID=A0A6M6JU78_9PSEU|nr:AI-2E family transporter [Pseudonocardia broussonetiae]